MLIKLLNVRKLTPFSRHVQHKPSAQPDAEETQHPLLALKLVHAGGNVESYYMAVPASRIMEKYPSFVLARPEVFRRPWDSVVRREEILNPGEKFFLVPRRTVKKLRQSIQKPNGHGDNISVNVRSFVSQSSKDVSAEMGSSCKIFRQRRREVSSSSEASESTDTTSRSSVERRRSERHNIKHVRFSEVSSKNVVEKKKKKKKGKTEENSRKKSNSDKDHGRKRSVTWHPTLDAINETSRSTDE